MDGGFSLLINPPPLKISPVFTLTHYDCLDPELEEVKAIWDYLAFTPYTILRISFALPNVLLILPKTRPYYRVWNISQSGGTDHILELRTASGHIIAMTTEQVDIIADDDSPSGYLCLQKAADPFPV